MRAPRALIIAILATALSAVAGSADAWKNGPPNNKVTNSAADCISPPYATHDWIADQAMLLLPREARAWMAPFRNLVLIGTEAPDYADIRQKCGIPNSGYNDTGKGRHDLRFDDFGNVTYDNPAMRAGQEYGKAIAAFRDGRADYAAFYLGAAMHYIGDMSQYGHTVKGETHHHDFEAWVATLTPAAKGSLFERFIFPDGKLEPRTAYDAVVRTGRFTWEGRAPVMSPADMDNRYDGIASINDAAFIESIGHCLNKAANEAAGMLFGFYETVVKTTPP